MNRKKHVELDRKPEFYLKEHTQDIMYGYWVNLAGKSKQMQFIDFDIWKT